MRLDVSVERRLRRLQDVVRIREDYAQSNGKALLDLDPLWGIFRCLTIRVFVLYADLL